MGGERLLTLGEKLAGFRGVEKIATPKNLHATLRPYQEAGLAWLQFLSKHQLAGVLADDMGLGKTVQTLAHILIEKEQGRLGAPVLVVAPTSMMNVWQSEAEKFAPTLKVLLSHGVSRKVGFEKMPGYDVVLTTYALLTRDEAELKKIKWHMVILDEAQNIKNAKTKAAAIVSMLAANHRLCLTGTPLENHLGELWSLFNFLMPGFLGEEKGFRERYRTPIEREGDVARMQFLSRRIKPFLLRRTKSEVAGDLPPKTEIIRTVDIAGTQADLYETVRVAMDKRVRDEIAAHGIAKSHIIVLDALLKLRQICCDPRLVTTVMEVKKKKAPSAKLELLLEMLDELLQEGRTILVFSQFASMLKLIEAELVTRHIDYVKLTGETEDRKTPVEQFQSGQVKVFLISLKAGGTGLTLTAADTVIHYDPWWNPAVENQATDRAHRIGQEKPVFVYKLVAKGTVEEKIVEMQKGKAALAAGILSGEATATSALSAEDLKALFGPL
jgi:SNF2 family DNA or RNA helicase